MDWKEALPLLQANHTGIAISVTPGGRAQATRNLVTSNPPAARVAGWEPGRK